MRSINTALLNNDFNDRLVPTDFFDNIEQQPYLALNYVMANARFIRLDESYLPHYEYQLMLSILPYCVLEPVLFGKCIEVIGNELLDIFFDRSPSDADEIIDQLKQVIMLLHEKPLAKRVPIKDRATNTDFVMSLLGPFVQSTRPEKFSYPDSDVVIGKEGFYSSKLLLEDVDFNRKLNLLSNALKIATSLSQLTQGVKSAFNFSDELLMRGFDNVSLSLYLMQNHISACVGFVEEHKDYVPVKEFDLILSVIAPVISSIDIIENEIIFLLVKVTDILIERSSNDKYLQKVQKLFSGVPQKPIHKIVFPALNRPSYFALDQPRLEEKLDASKLIKEIVGLNTDEEKLEYNSDTDSDDEVDFDEPMQNSWLQMLTAYQAGQINIYNLRLVARIMLVRSKDPMHHAELIIDAIKVKSSIWQQSEIPSTMLESFILLLAIADDYLNKGELDALLQVKGCVMPTVGLAGSVVGQDALRMQGRRAASMLSITDDNILSKLPIYLQMALRRYGSQIEGKFKSFVALCNKVNNKAKGVHQRNLTLFFAQHGFKILQLIDIMGGEVISLLRSKVAFTLLSLERLLVSVPQLDGALIPALRDYFISLSITAKNNPDDLSCFIAALGVIGSLRKLEHKSARDYRNPIVSEKMKIRGLLAIVRTASAGKSAREFLRNLAGRVIGRILPNRKMAFGDKQIMEMFARITPDDFAKLVCASQKMAGDSLNDVFLHLLELDLTGGDVDAFLHDVHQTDPLGRSIALHNQKKREFLRAHNIDPDHAINFPESYDFIVTSQGGYDNAANNQRAGLWDYLVKLQRQADIEVANLQPDSNALKKLNKILKLIKQINANVFSRDSKADISDMAAALQKPSCQPIISKIVGNLAALEKDKAPTSDAFKEFAEHFRQQVELIYQSRANHSVAVKKAKKAKTYYLTAKRWPKEDAMTFFLAAYVRCCLSPDGERFKAMVERRLDDAMLFDVVIDKATGEPLALAWLFLAENKEGKVVLAVNFFEIQAKLGENTTLRQSVLNGELQFIQRYLKCNPNIAGFVMNVLTYGWHKGDLDSYEIIDNPLVGIVGGEYTGMQNFSYSFFSPQATPYYISSLKQDKLHRFCDAVLLQNHMPTCLSIDKMLRVSIREFANANLPIDEWVDKVVNRHQIELTYFYGSIPATNVILRQKIEAMISENLEEKHSLQDVQVIKQDPLGGHSVFAQSAQRLYEIGDGIVDDSCNFCVVS